MAVPSSVAVKPKTVTVAPVAVKSVTVANGNKTAVTPAPIVSKTKVTNTVSTTVAKATNTATPVSTPVAVKPKVTSTSSVVGLSVRNFDVTA